MYTGNPSGNPLDRVRILCSDTDNDDLLIEQSVLEWFYESNNKNERRAALQCLKYMMLQLSKMADEKVGGVYEKNSDRLANFKKVYDELMKTSIRGTPYAGGISQSDIDSRRHNPDSVRKGVEAGDSFSYHGDRFQNDDFWGSPNRMGVVFVDKEK